MQQQRLYIIRNLLSLHSFALLKPKCLETCATRCQREPQQMQNFAFHRYLTQATTTKTDDQKTKKLQQKITLIAQNQAMSVTTLEEAQKLAKRRDLHLLRMKQTDAKTGRAMFKLVTAAEMLADDLDDKEGAKSTADKGNKKSEKSLTIGTRITDHDLASRLKNITKWLNKRHEVRILIQGSVSRADEGSAEHIVKTIETTIKDPQVIGKIVQKRQKGAYIKFSIMPVSTSTPITPSPPTTDES